MTSTMFVLRFISVFVTGKRNKSNYAISDYLDSSSRSSLTEKISANFWLRLRKSLPLAAILYKD